MIAFEVKGITDVINMFDVTKVQVKHGMGVAIQQLANIGVQLGRPMIPLGDAGPPHTRDRLLATMEGEAKARVTVRGSRRHILRFLEGGTRSHGRGGGPLPAHHIMERLHTQLEALAGNTMETALESSVGAATFATVPRLRRGS
jgi:hypothetical protein